jgi:prepilin-type N-terminal cleavage/methylation domain-containing protein
MRRTRRPGFTLVEVMAALAIGAVLLAAVYGTLTYMLRSIQTGKEVVASMQVIRGVAIRISTDIRQSLALQMSTPSIADLVEQAQQANQTTPMTGGSTTTTQDTAAPRQFNFGLQGDLQTLTIYGNNTPKYSQLDADLPNSVFSDLRMIQYTLTPEGLVRQEMVNVLSDAPESTSNPELIAPEVKSLQFKYYDATQPAWVEQWDGTVNGPPSAVEVTVTVEMPPEPGQQPRPAVTHRFVVAIPTFGSPVPPASPTTGGTQP